MILLNIIIKHIEILVSRLREYCNNHSCQSCHFNVKHSDECIILILERMGLQE